MATGKRVEPFHVFHFRVEIEGLAVASFSEVSGLSMDGDTTDYREGLDPPYVRKYAGLEKVSGPIILKRGMTQDDTLWKWRARVAAGMDDRRHGSIVLMNEARRDVIRWNFENGFPNKIEGPSLKAADNGISIESCEIVHEHLTIEIEPAP